MVTTLNHFFSKDYLCASSLVGIVFIGILLIV